jgi:hypothetical protein
MPILGHLDPQCSVECTQNAITMTWLMARLRAVLGGDQPKLLTILLKDFQKL